MFFSKVGFEGHDDTWLAHQDDFQVRSLYLLRCMIILNVSTFYYLSPTVIFLNPKPQAVLAALNVEHGSAGEGMTETEKKASLEVTTDNSQMGS